MRRLLGFLLQLILLVAVAVWLADRPGTARIVWHGYVIESSAAFLGLCAFALGYVFFLLFRFWRLLKHGPEEWRTRRRLRKFKEGQQQLEKGFTAIAGGNASEAGRLAVHARKLLGTTVATQLLQAQAAQLAGDTGAAREIFRALAANGDSAVLGYRGLIMDARREKDWGEVNALVEKLQLVKPNTPWLNLVRFELLTRRQEWAEANSVLSQIKSARLLEPRQSSQYRAAILVAKSQAEAKQRRPEQALQAAEQAVKQAPEWPPAVINLAEKQMVAGHRRAAYRTVEKNWDKMPHPQLAAVYRAGYTDALDAYKQMERLCSENLDTTSRLALAEAALAADIWGETRRYLIVLVSRGQATQSVYRLLARLERRESGNEQAALQWLTKAVDAAPDPVWLCQSCGGAQEEWHATCKYCGEFDKLAWQIPGQSRAPAKQTSLLNEMMLD